MRGRGGGARGVREWACTARGRGGISKVHWRSSGGRKRGIPFSNELTSSAVRARACVNGCERLAGVARVQWLGLTMWSPFGTCRTTGPLIRRGGVAARVPPARDVSTAPWLLATAAASQSARRAIWKGVRSFVRRVQEKSQGAKSDWCARGVLDSVACPVIPPTLARCRRPTRVGCIGAAQRSRSRHSEFL